MDSLWKAVVCICEGLVKMDGEQLMTSTDDDCLQHIPSAPINQLKQWIWQPLIYTASLLMRKDELLKKMNE